jgi:2-methylcitrate dehydratase PrpD
MEIGNMTNKNPLRELAKFARETRYEDLPPSIVHETRRVLMDSIGCTIGALTMDKGKMYMALARRFGGNPEASIPGLNEKVSLSNAAMTNAELMFTLDFHNIMSGAHDVPYTVPAILAAAESTGASGKDLILATALGLEISSRLAKAVLRHFTPWGTQVRAERASGPQRTGNAYSNFGAAAGAGRLMKLDEEHLLHAMGLAGHMCQALTYGRWGYSERRYMSKYGIPGYQGTGAINAVLLADMGYTGDTSVLDSGNGFAFFMGYKDWHPELILEDIGQTWNFDYRLHYKPYPCCGVFHCALDCFDEIIEKNNILPSEIERVHAYLRAGMDGLFGQKDLECISAAQFNPRYMFSMLAHRVKRGPEWYDAYTMKDPEILQFMDKVSWQMHPDYDRALREDPLSALSKCEVVARGQTFMVERKHRRGTTGTESAPTDKDITDKFRHNASRILTQEKIERAVKAFAELENITSISQLIRELTP